MPASVGAIALILAAYLKTIVPLAGISDRWIAAAVIALLATLNYRSLKWGAGLENVVSGAKVIALAALGVVAFTMGESTAGALSGPITFAPSSWSGFGLAMVTVMWSYSGWSSSAALAGEVRDPARNMPRAVLGGVSVVIVLYLVTNAAYLRLLPVEAIAGSRLVAAAAMSRVLGEAGASLVALLVVVSTFGAVQAALMFNPRIFYAMASDGLLFAPIGRVHAEFRTPHLATLFTAALGIVYVSVRSFDQLAQAFILGVWPFEILMVWSVFRLRRLQPDAPRPFRTPGYPFVPALFLVALVLDRPGESAGLSLACAVIPFQLVMLTIVNAMTTLDARRPILLNMAFKRMLLPISAALTESVAFSSSLLLLIAMMAIYGVAPTWNVLRFPLVLLVNVFLAIAAAYAAVLFGIWLRELRAFVTSFVRTLFFLAPGLVPLAETSEDIRDLLRLNPLTGLFEAYRDVFMDGTRPALWELLVPATAAVALLAIFVPLYRAEQRQFAKVI